MVLRATGPITRPPETCIPDPDLTVMRVVPWGCVDGVALAQCCDAPAIPGEHLVTHARDTIRVPDGAPGTRVWLDSGMGEGYIFPMPCDCIYLDLRYKGTSCFCLSVDTVFAQFDGAMEIRWPLAWARLPVGYYEARIRFIEGPHSRFGGWLLFYKEPAPKVRAVRSETVRRRAELQPPGTCQPGREVSWIENEPQNDCGAECGGCGDED